ncbi:MAG: hypothetical protein QOC98_2165 [Frankiaceae bacterium]|nr:hypothetical protein [Frankiaceae bacterium]
MDETQPLPDDQHAEPDQTDTKAEAEADSSVPTGGNAAQARAVFGEHAEPAAEMDSGGAG